jgi:anti-sigma factor (TIGR02949 family)
MNCQEALDRLYDIIDKEASEVDEAAVREHLEHCQHCGDIYKVEVAINDFVQARLKSNVPQGELRSLKTKVFDELDKIDSNCVPARRRMPFGNVSMMLAAAAALVLLVGLSLLPSSFFKHQAQLIPLEQAHLDGLDRLDDYRDVSLTASSVARVDGEMHYRLDPVVHEFDLLGGRLKEVMGVQMGHFIYANDDQYVSVFVAPAAMFPIPEVLKGNGIARDDVNFYDHFCRGCRLVYHHQGDVVIVTATVEKQVELLDFIPGYSTI